MNCRKYCILTKLRKQEIVDRINSILCQSNSLRELYSEKYVFKGEIYEEFFWISPYFIGGTELLRLRCNYPDNDNMKLRICIQYRPVFYILGVFLLLFAIEAIVRFSYFNIVCILIFLFLFSYIIYYSKKRMIEELCKCLDGKIVKIQ